MAEKIGVALFWLFLLGIFGGSALAVDYGKTFIKRNEITIAVRQLEVAQECRKSRSLVQGFRYRSEVPALDVFGYCGIVSTDHGGFKIAESARINLFRQSRQEILGRLKEGCAFRVKTFGFQDLNQKGQALPNDDNSRTIFKVISKAGCG